MKIFVEKEWDVNAKISNWERTLFLLTILKMFCVYMHNTLMFMLCLFHNEIPRNHFSISQKPFLILTCEKTVFSCKINRDTCDTADLTGMHNFHCQVCHLLSVEFFLEEKDFDDSLLDAASMIIDSFINCTLKNQLRKLRAERRSIITS